MASVYMARHKRTGHCAAIKILHPEFAVDSEVHARFVQEAHAVNRLGHPAAVGIHDVDITPDGQPYLVMELLDGETLAKQLSAGPVDTQRALELADAVLDVLEAAHSQGVIHRDIKPDNLFVLADGSLKVLDFGIARVRDSTRVKTKIGTALGTPSYMPPEQIKGVDVDHRADIFAMGAVLFELVTGRCIHQADNHQQLLIRMLTQPAPPLKTVAPHVRDAVCMIVDRALQLEQHDRYPDAATMRADIQAVRHGELPPFAAAAFGDLVPATTQLDDPLVLVVAQITHSVASLRARLADGFSRRFVTAIAAGVALGAMLVVLIASAAGDPEPPRQRSLDTDTQVWHDTTSDDD